MIKTTLKLLVDQQEELTVDVMVFPGGEVQVKVDNPWRIQQADTATIITKIRCAAGIQALLQLKSIVDHYGPVKEVLLYLGYVPYSRQDRVCSEGESNAIRVFASQINALNFNKVVTVDNHSDVSTALINNVANMTKEDLFENLDIPFEDYDVFVAPDFGAAKEVQALAAKYDKRFVQGFKKRDPKTGYLTGFGHYCPESDMDDLNVLIIDDLCDGGGTFLGLAEDIKYNHVPSKLSLYVTHGLFSKGTEELTSTFDDVYTTDTLIDNAAEEFCTAITVVAITPG